MILIVEEQPLIALELQTALEEAGAEALIVRNAAEALTRVHQFDFSAAVLDWLPDSSEQRALARLLKQTRARFIFYATHPPEDVTTARGAPIFSQAGAPAGNRQSIGDADRRAIVPTGRRSDAGACRRGGRGPP